MLVHSRKYGFATFFVLERIERTVRMCVGIARSRTLEKKRGSGGLVKHTIPSAAQDVYHS